MMFIPLFSHLLLVLVATTTSLASTSLSLKARESTRSEYYDPYIICEGNGPTHSEGLPSAYSTDDYALNLHLCSAAHGVPRHNIGCSCSRSNANVHCSESIADPTLWNAIYKSFDRQEVEDAMNRGFPDGAMPFWEYCWDNCLCVDEEEAYETVGANLSDMISVLHQLRTGELAGQNDGTVTAAAAGASHASYGMNTFGQGTFQGGTWQGNGHPAAIKNQCGRNCTTDRDCKGPSSATAAGAAAGIRGGGPEGSNCTCRTQSSQYQPGSGVVAFAAACLIDMAKGGKRDEEWPCPCNTSYVSHGCCGASDGLVWEPEEFKLGELLV